MHHLTIPALTEFKIITVHVKNDVIELFTGHHGHIKKEQSTKCVCVLGRE